MLIERKVKIPELARGSRRLFIYVPDESKTEPTKRYPVLYMFDGHNVFLDSTATYGKSWGMLEYLQENQIPLIVVAPECNHEGNRRLEEYSPYDESNWKYGPIRGQGRITMRWMSQRLKPAIDREYPTIPDREHTYIAGSSMGGLMALYAVSVWNHVYSRAAALSPSIYVGDEALLGDIRRSKLAANTRIYMDMGSEEMGEYRLDVMARMEKINHALLRKGADTCMRVVSGGNHSEASWERQIPVFMHALGLQYPDCVYSVEEEDLVEFAVNAVAAMEPSDLSDPETEASEDTAVTIEPSETEPSEET